MDIAYNLKRRRDGEKSLAEEGEKKHHKKTSPKPSQQQKSESKSPSQPQPKEKKSKTKTQPQQSAQFIPPPQQQQQENTQTQVTEPLPFSPRLLSLSLVSTPNIFSRSHSENREPAPSPTRKRNKSASNETRQVFTRFYFCADILDPTTFDHHLKKNTKPVDQFKKIKGKDVTNPYLFRGEPMVTTFVRSAGTRTKELWRFLEDASRTGLEHPSLNQILHQCTGRVPIYVHPSFYRALKLLYPMDVGRISRDGRVTNELSSGSLRQAVNILTPEDFRSVVDSE